jgi:hypothetical protein
MIEEKKTSHKDFLRDKLEETKVCSNSNSIGQIKLNPGIKPINFIGYVVL